MKKITDEWIKEKKVCSPAIDWWDKKERDPIIILRKLIAEKRYEWANWFIVRIMSEVQYREYIIFTANSELKEIIKKYPHNKYPLLAINTAKEFLKNPSPKNKKEANTAYDAAYGYANAVSRIANLASIIAHADTSYSAIHLGISVDGQPGYSAKHAAVREKRLSIVLRNGIKLLKNTDVNHES